MEPENLYQISKKELENELLCLPGLKDDDGSDEVPILELHITPVCNGYILSISSDEEEWKEVYMAKFELITRIEELT